MKSILFNTHDLALIFTIYQSLLFALFLLTLKKGKKLSNVLLALFLLAQAAIPLDNLINYGEAFKFVAIDISPNLFFTFGLAYWLEAPLLFLYVRSMMYKNYKLTKWDALYFVPFILYAFDFSMDWLMLDINTKLMIIQGDSIAEARVVDRVVHIARECMRLAFAIMCVVELNKYQKLIRNEVADVHSVDLNWLKMLVIGFLVIRIDSLFVALAILFSFEFGFSVNFEVLGLAGNYSVMLLISGLIFFSAGYSNVFKGVDRELSKQPEKLKEPKDPEKMAAITNYMQQSKPYLNHLLTLDGLANQLDMPPRSLSVIINRDFNKNFFEFVNYFRIEESKALLTNVQNRKATMLDVMDKSGFNSKATFNTFFKKLVGVTPSQYRKEYWSKHSD